jgi:hypothetical protein
MLFFRSEETLKSWCDEHHYNMGPIVTMDQLWGMATTWYGSRLQEESRRPQPAEIRQVFADLGLKGDFWDPQSDSFG